MPNQTLWLTALLLSACSAEAPPVRVLVAEEAPRETAVAAANWLVQADMAGEARDFFFGQADLYLAGVRPADDDKLAEVLRAMGREDLVDGAGTPPGPACPRPWVEPVEMIAHATSGSRIVIIESDRHAPAQTAFVQALVTRLAAEGFSAFADDGLSLGPAGIGHPEVLLVSEGLVTRDPAQGRLMRAVKHEGMQLVDAGVWWSSARELAGLSPEAHLARRQSALADQISQRAFARDPDARLLIHTERAADPAAAAAFKAAIAEVTGHHPTLIALTSCSGGNAQPVFLPGYGDDAGHEADLVYAIPLPATKGGRLTSGRSAEESLVPIPPAFLNADSPVLVEARRAADPDLAVPEDRVMLLPGDNLPLLLPPGDYRIEAWTREGSLSAAIPVNVT